MDLKQLEYFLCVAELGSFTRASITLDVAQPALSRQVRMLEVELRQNLLLRNGRGASPTEAGKLLMEHARGILHQVQRTQEALGRARGALVGKVAIGLPPTLARLITVPLTRQLRVQLPEVQVSISEALSCTMQEWMMTGRLDIAILYNASAMSGLDTMHLFNDPLMLISRKQAHHKAEPNKIEVKDLANKPLVIPTRPNAIRMYVETEMAAIGLCPTIEIEIDGVAAILDIISDGTGYAILPSHAIARQINHQDYLIQQVGTPALHASVCISTSGHRPTTSAQHATLELIKQIINQECQTKSLQI